MPDIDFEKLTLNAIPDGEVQIFHASQYETARPFFADLFWGESEFAVGEGCWCEITIRKNDDNLVVITDIESDGNEINCILPQQAVTCYGSNVAQLKIWAHDEDDNDVCVAFFNFIIKVQPDPGHGGITSQSEIDNLTEQIETIAHEVIGEDYYDKTEVDNLISGVESQIPTKTSDLINDSDFITSDDLTPYAKTSDLAPVATTGNYDDLLNKPTIPDAQVQSDWEQADNTKVDYIKNKPDIDAMIANALLEVMPVGTESGAIASFDTEIAAPLVNVSCDIVATGGNGTPDNPNPINGYTEANITANGDTVTISFGQTVYGGVLDVTRGKLTVTHFIKDSFVYGETALIAINQYNIANFGIVISTPFKFLEGAIANCLERQYTSGSDTQTPGFFINNSNELYVRLESTTASTVSDFVTWANANLQILFTLDTPFDIDLTPEVISAIVGTNNVYSDTNGDTTVQYKDSIQHYIDTRI